MTHGYITNSETSKMSQFSPTEYDKWTVLRNKSDLREMNEYRSVFLEQDVSREEREKRQVMIRERKAEWELRGKTDQRRKNLEKRSQP